MSWTFTLEHEPDFNSPAYIDELVRVRPNLSLPYSSPYNSFVRANHWKPRWQAELHTAVDGLAWTLLERYDHGGLSGAYEARDNAYRYRDEAFSNLRSLARVSMPGVSPKAEWILADELTMSAMADYLLGTNELAANDFMPHNRNGRPTKARQKRLSALEDDIRQFSLPQVSRLYHWNVIDESQRGFHWERQIRLAEEVITPEGEPLVGAILQAIDEAEIVSQEDVIAEMRLAA